MWGHISSQCAQSQECTIDFLPHTQDTHDFFTIAKKCWYLPSPFSEQLDFESKLVSLLLYSEVYEQLGLESSWVTCEKSRQSITCPVCTFVPITTVIQTKYTHTHACLGVKVNTIYSNVKYYTCAMGLIYSYCGIHNSVISWLWSA